MDEAKLLDLLMGMSRDVSEIKTDMKHVKQEVEGLKDEMANKNADFEKRISNVESKIRDLENKDSQEDAKKWRKATGYILAVLGTTVVTFLFAHIGDLIRSLGNV